MFVVFGATGKTGKAAAQALLEQGVPVRVAVRDTRRAEELARQGAEVVRADLDTGEGLSEALRGATAVYYLNPPDSTHPDPIGLARGRSERMRRVFEEAGVPRVVALSSVGSQHPEGTGMIRTTYDLEQIFAGASFRVTFLRAAYFLDNWLPLVETARAGGVLPSLIDPDLSLEMVATADIGRTAAELLRDEQAPGVVELAGPEALSPAQVAERLGQGRDIRAVALPDGERGKPFQAWGASPAGVAAMLALFDGANRGRVSFERPDSVRRGTRPVESVLLAEWTDADAV